MVVVPDAEVIPEAGRAVGEAFNGVAARYDEDFTDSRIGRLQREAVWRQLDSRFQPGERVLDLGCGTGADAIHLAGRGLRIHAIDASERMIIETRRKVERAGLAEQITAEVLAIEDWIEDLDRQDCLSHGLFDGAISNFGALNCVQHLRPVARGLSRLIRPRGALALCLISRFCLWETAFFCMQGRFAKAERRWSHAGQATASLSGSVGFRVYYRSIRDVVKAFHPEFRLQRHSGIGIFVPPTYLEAQVRRVSRLTNIAARVDQTISAWPVCRAAADHAFVLFTREND
jgi:2-polyprenyl-3-methyl-5-hydroxy-6-metoxy-1,4-benzoquinol methylase